MDLKPIVMYTGKESKMKKLKVKVFLKKHFIKAGMIGGSYGE